MSDDGEILGVPLARLRERRSAKWRMSPDDVLPLTIAEMDVELAAPVASALRRAIANSDTGYGYGYDDGELLALAGHQVTPVLSRPEAAPVA